LTFTCFISSKAGKYEKKVQDELVTTQRKWNYIIGILSDTAYYKDIFIFNMQKMIFGKLSLLGNEKRKGFQKTNDRNCLKNNVFSVLSAMQQMVIYIVFSTLVFKRIITIGQYTMYVAAVYAFYSAASQTINDTVFIMQQNEYVKDFRAFMDLDVRDEKAQYAPLPEAINKITFIS